MDQMDGAWGGEEELKEEKQQVIEEDKPGDEYGFNLLFAESKQIAPWSKDLLDVGKRLCRRKRKFVSRFDTGSDYESEFRNCRRNFKSASAGHVGRKYRGFNHPGNDDGPREDALSEKEIFGLKWRQVARDNRNKLDKAREDKLKFSEIGRTTNATERLKDFSERIRVDLVATIAPDEFYVRLPEDTKYMETLVDAIEDFVFNCPNPALNDYELDNVILNGGFVLINSDNIYSWCRGYIIKEDGLVHAKRKLDPENPDSRLYNTKVSVYLFDHGWKQYCYPFELVRCPDHLVNFDLWPIKIIRCGVHGLIPCDPRTDWEWDAVKYFDGFLIDYQKLWVKPLDTFFIDGDERRIQCSSVSVQYIGYEVKYRRKDGTIDSDIIRLHHLDRVLISLNYARPGSWLEYTRDFHKELYKGSINVSNIPNLPGLVAESELELERQRLEEEQRLKQEEFQRKVVEEKLFVKKISEIEARYDIVLFGTLIDPSKLEDVSKEGLTLKIWDETEMFWTDADDEEVPFHFFKPLEYPKKVTKWFKSVNKFHGKRIEVTRRPFSPLFRDTDHENGNEDLEEDNNQDADECVKEEEEVPAPRARKKYHNDALDAILMGCKLDSDILRLFRAIPPISYTENDRQSIKANYRKDSFRDTNKHYNFERRKKRINGIRGNNLELNCANHEKKKLTPKDIAEKFSYWDDVDCINHVQEALTPKQISEKFSYWDNE